MAQAALEPAQPGGDLGRDCRGVHIRALRRQPQAKKVRLIPPRQRCRIMRRADLSGVLCLRKERGKERLHFRKISRRDLCQGVMVRMQFQICL